ncbi:MAG: GNAT family N-acetyltransferase [Alphaproteobacteria bacterium]|nr:GNAT family N-acetyltransferase [Alphaproteobacteria bacterium]
MAEPETNPKPFLVRSARQDDLPVLLAFEQGIITAERPYDHTLKPDPISYYDIAELIASDDAEVAVIELDGQVVASGFAMRKVSKAYVQDEHHAYLGFMYVRPDYRGRSLNQHLLAHLSGWAKANDLHEIRLTVYSDNAPAIRAYEKARFTSHIVEMRLNLDE